MSKELTPDARKAAGSPREKVATPGMLRSILIIELLVIAALALSDWLSQVQRTAYIAMPVLAALLICTWLLYRGVHSPAQIAIPLGALFLRDYLALEGVGIHDVSLLTFAAIVILAYLTLEKPLALVLNGLTIISATLIGLGEMYGLLVNNYSNTTNFSDVVEIFIVLVATSLITYILVDRLNENIERAYRHEQAQIKANQALEEERANLEARVKERTQDLERRASQLRAAAEVGSAAAASRDLDILLGEGSRLLSARFDFYHVGIFLKDETGKFAVLRAANSEGGRRMLRRGHQLEIGQVGIVGYVTQTGKARIALDVGRDAVYFDNPDLPQTRSEMALPLVVADRILGALDIQSTEPQAFKQDDIEVLQVVADQLAVAIENSRLLAESHAAMDAMRRAYGEASLQAWRRWLETHTLAFKSDERGGLAETDPSRWSVEEQQVIREGTPVKSQNERTLFVPMLQRGQAVGVIKLAKHDQAHWSASEIQLAQTLAAQLSDSLEAARLYDEAQRRAERERAIAEMSGKISSVYGMDDILRLMTEELGKMFDDSEVVVQMAQEQK
ncbi:MAG TPA: GAF domain-containing protein [Anaerolineales bacterium]|nr:GAF domain-containing protein [Anaerolineales bacterium]